MREPISKISNTIKHRYLNQARITRTRKWIYLKIIGINMIVNMSTSKLGPGKFGPGKLGPLLR